MGTKEKDQKEREDNVVDNTWTNQLLIVAFFIFLVLLGYLVR